MKPPDALSIPRLVPEEPFPAYAHVPGQTPHPRSDPAGHSFQVAERVPEPVLPEMWACCRAYLYGFDLFNHGYFWESHEAWEGLWHAAGRRGPTADFLKALIKLAAAGVKHREGNRAGVHSHAVRAAKLWQGVARSLGAEGSSFLGFHLEDLIGLARRVSRDGWPERLVLTPQRREPDTTLTQQKLT